MIGAVTAGLCIVQASATWDGVVPMSAATFLTASAMARPRSLGAPFAAAMFLRVPMLVNHRLDVLAWNPEMAALTLDFGALPHEQRNMLRLCLLYPPLYDLYCDRERVIREGIADLRAAWAAHPEDTALGELVAELTSHSTEFARLWPKQCVKVNGRGLRPLLHPRVGPLTVEYEVLTPLQDPDQRVIIYRAADTASQAAMDAIARESERPWLRVL
jgi:MmyB-like transcription regulator ligand binding domain